MWWIFLLGCEPGSSAEGAETPSAWEYQDSSAAAAPDAAQLAADVQDSLDGLRWVRARDPLNSFRAAWSYASGPCAENAAHTESESTGSTLYFDNLCESGGYVFKGPALLHTWTDDLLEPIAAMQVSASLPPEALYTGYGFNGQTDIYSTDGRLDFNCSCTMVEVNGVDRDGSKIFFGYTQGPAHYTGPEGVGTWMDQPAIDPELSWTVKERDGVRSIDSAGKLSGVGGRYDAVHWRITGLSKWIEDRYRCVSGGISAEFTVRDSETLLWEEFSLSSTPECTLCGSIEGVGEVCVEPTVFFDWEDNPWD
jgi:hypothetical protein